MSNKTLSAFIFAITLFYASFSSAATQFQMGVGLVISSDYSDRIDEIYSDYDKAGGFGWLKLDLDILHPLTDQLYLNPRVSFAANFIHVDGGHLEETYFNTLILPALGVRYYLNPVYVFALANLPLPATGSDHLEFDSDGLGFELGLGTAIGQNSYLEIAYLDAPFKINNQKGNYGGGLAVAVGFKF